MLYRPSMKDLDASLSRIRSLFPPTPLEHDRILSSRHGAEVFLKREDMTPIRSYKIRGAFNKMSTLSLRPRISTCSAGNHAQGVAYSCSILNLQADIFMPRFTTQQKIQKVLGFGGEHVKLFLEGDTFDEAYEKTMRYSEQQRIECIHPFNDPKIIEGQATVAMELVEQTQQHPLEYLFVPVGGGGLSSGVSWYMKQKSPTTKIIGVEPLGAASMTEALRNGYPIRLPKIDPFVDGAAVRCVGYLNFPLCKEGLDAMITIDEGHVCSKLLQMYNESGLILEPAGVLSLCALDTMDAAIKGKRVGCILSGGNADVFRMPEIMERSLVYEGRKHYFRIEFPQRAGALRDFLLNVLGPGDDIFYFRYTKLINKETGPVILGIETKSKESAVDLIRKMTQSDCIFTKLPNVADI
jgi:threonine dehydratase